MTVEQLEANLKAIAAEQGNTETAFWSFNFTTLRHARDGGGKATTEWAIRYWPSINGPIIAGTGKTLELAYADFLNPQPSIDEQLVGISQSSEG